MSQEKHVTHNDFDQIKEKVDWVEIHGAAAVTRKTMGFVKEGCRRAWGPPRAECQETLQELE